MILAHLTEVLRSDPVLRALRWAISSSTTDAAWQLRSRRHRGHDLHGVVPGPWFAPTPHGANPRVLAVLVDAMIPCVAKSYELRFQVLHPIRRATVGFVIPEHPGTPAQVVPELDGLALRLHPWRVLDGGQGDRHEAATLKRLQLSPSRPHSPLFLL